MKPIRIKITGWEPKEIWTFRYYPASDVAGYLRPDASMSNPMPINDIDEFFDLIESAVAKSAPLTRWSDNKKRMKVEIEQGLTEFVIDESEGLS